MLAPTLAPGDIVLLDNLRSHKTAGIAEAIIAREAQLIYLPPYSPDLNPIEQCGTGACRKVFRARFVRKLRSVEPG
jgi:transposase